jgi:hypothetical protein
VGNGTNGVGIATIGGLPPASTIVRLNTLLGSSLADMSDGDPACGSAVDWTSNTFQTMVCG